MLSFLYVYSDHSILECYNLFSGVELSMRSFFVIIHTPSGWCVYSHFSYGNLTNPLTQYRGPDCVNEFCKHIISEAKRLYNSFPEKPMAPLTKSQLKEYKRATKCHICFKPFSEKKKKVRDHCHYSGALWQGSSTEN